MAEAKVEGAVVIDQIKIKSKRPSMKELNRYVTRRYAPDWYDIGIELGLELDVNITEKDNPQQSVTCFQKTLGKWLSNDGATWKELELALTNVNRAKLGLDPVDDVYGAVNVPGGNQPDTQVLPSVVLELCHDLCDNYKNDRQGPYTEEWPPNQPSSIVNLALIHYQNMRTQQELIEFSKRSKEGASCIDKLAASHSNVTKDIKELFMSDAATESRPPKRILIEGAPGIGKTVLAKEIAYQWANGEILKEYKLVFLLYLRDPKVQKVKSISEILELFTSENTPDLIAYIKKSRGKNVALVLDGFDEYPVASQEKSFITDLIKCKNDGKLFLNSTKIVTSRPTATLFLHKVVDRRIEILGFPKEERDKYVSMSLRDSPDKAQELDKYLKLHPIINSVCYIPLHLAILMYLFKQDSLPETLTEMNDSFVINTIYRYLDKKGSMPPGVVKKLTDLPENIVRFVYKLANLAFNGLENNQLVFSLDEIKKICPEVDDINGFGLLQAVQHYPKKGAGRTTSVNFLHFTMQEYLAALHVSTHPSWLQSSLIERTFWNGQFNFMWMMYVGIVGVKSEAFASIAVRNIYNDKLKCLHLFQCYVEAKSDKKMPKTISSVFADGNITLSSITLLPHHISSLMFFMSASSGQQWRILKLYDCNLGDVGMNSLLEHVIKNNERISTLEHVDLSRNNSSPWGVYFAIIRYCCVNSLTLCGDEGIMEHVKEITDSLQTNMTLQSLTFCDIESNAGMHAIHDLLLSNTTLKELNVSWKSYCKGTAIIRGKLVLAPQDSKTKAFKIFPKNFVIFKEDVNDIIMNLLCGRYKFAVQIQEFHISCNNIVDDIAAFISDYLKYNNTLKVLNLSHNHITLRGMNKLCKSIKHCISLQYVDLSGNNSSPWGVYCAIIKHCCVNSLMLCGDDGMKEYVKEFIKNLKTNPALQSLTLFKVGSIGVQSIKDVLDDNSTLKELNLSWRYGGTMIIHRQLACDNLIISNTKSCSNSHGVVHINVMYDGNYQCSSEAISISNEGINDDIVHVILFGMYDNTALQEFDLSCNEITDDGAVVIADYLKHNYPLLKKLNLSKNRIKSKGMNELSQAIKYPIPLEHVDLSGNNSSPWGVYCAIIRHCCITSLTLCGDEGIKEYIKEIIDSLQINVVLQSLILSAANFDNYRNFRGLISGIQDSEVCVYDGLLYFSTLGNDDRRAASSIFSNSRMVKIKIMYDGMCYHSPEIIKLSNRVIIDDDTTHLIALFGLYNNTAAREFDFSCNRISEMKWLSECLKCARSLQYVDLSGNKLSPWGMYCTVIENCCVNSLTLCGDEGIEEYVKEVEKVLKRNMTLESLTLYKIGGIGLQSIKIILSNNITLKELNMSWQCKSAKRPLICSKFKSTTLCSNNHEGVVDINILCDSYFEGSLSEVVHMSRRWNGDNAVYLITFGLYNNTTVKKLDLSYNLITDYGIIAITECLKTNNTIRELNLSHNCITSKGAKQIAKVMRVNKHLLTLDLSDNRICSDGVMFIRDSLKHNNTLLELKL